MKMTKHLLYGLAFIIALVMTGHFLGTILDRTWFDTFIHNQGTASQLIFMLACSSLMCVGLSRQLVAFLAGYGFGFVPGLLTGMLAVMLACFVTFGIARTWLHTYLKNHYQIKIRKIACFIRNHTFSVTLLLRLSPVGNNWLMNIAAGATNVSSVPFFVGSFLGYIPQMLIFTLVGSGSHLSDPWQITIAIVLFVVSAMLFTHLYTRYRLHGQLADPGESAI